MSTEKTALYYSQYVDTLLWAIPGPALILNTNFEAVKANSPFYELFGIIVPAIGSRSIYDIFAGSEDLPEIKKFLENLRGDSGASGEGSITISSHGISCSIKARSISASAIGSGLIVLVVDNNTQQPDGMDINGYITFTDVLEEKVRSTTKELEQSKTFLDTILNSADIGIASYEPIYNGEGVIIDFRITYTNSDVPQNFGLTTEDVIGKTCAEVYPGIFANGIFNKMKTAIETGISDTYEIKVPVNGQIIWLAATIEIVNGSLTITSKNITAEKEAALNLEKMNRLLNTQNEDLASFTYIASHDLQEPLRKIRMFTGRILETERENFAFRTLDYFNTITTTVQRMQNLINDLLIYSKMDAEALLFEPTDLSTAIKEVTAAIDDALTENGAVLEIGDLPVISGVPTQIRQLFSNIILNAVKYRKQDVDPVIKIAAERDNIDSEQFWKVSISDNGIGFDIEYKDKIFEVFQRLHGKQEYAGSGIGLAICKKIMQNHRGHISASSVQGVGSVFAVYFPVRE